MEAARNGRADDIIALVAEGANMEYTDRVRRFERTHCVFDETASNESRFVSIYLVGVYEQGEFSFHFKNNFAFALRYVRGFLHPFILVLFAFHL